jgi:hypothetical protein
VHGVFARKTIPKRTQFGPIEGVLVKPDDPHMILAEGEEPQLELLVESETGAMLKLDTGCESKHCCGTSAVTGVLPFYITIMNFVI